MEGVGEQEKPRWLTSTGDSCSGCSSGTSDSFGRYKLYQARRSRQNAPVKIPPNEASGNPWHMLLIKSPPNDEEQWKRSDNPILSGFHRWQSSWVHTNSLLGKQQPPPPRDDWPKKHIVRVVF